MLVAAGKGLGRGRLKQGSATWTARPSGGNGVLTWAWYVSKNGGPFTLKSSSQSYTRTMEFGIYSLVVRQQAASLGEVVTTDHYVSVDCGGC